MWDYLDKQGFIGCALAHATPAEQVDYLVAELRRVAAAGQSMRGSADSHAAMVTNPAAASRDAPPDAPRDQAARARIDALSAVYAAWANTDTDVEWFRRTALVDQETAEFRAFIDGHHPYPRYRLLAAAGVQQWVLDQHQRGSGHGDGAAQVRGLLAQPRSGGDEPTVTLAYHADRQHEHLLTVDARGTLGELARLAEQLAERYRCRPSQAATLVLTGAITPEVFVYAGAAQLRYGATAAATRVTLTLDPFLTPDQVAGIYGRLRARMQPRPTRSLSIKHYRLVEHVGPHVRSYLAHPGAAPRRGRLPRPGPTGLAHFVDPVGGHTWKSLRHDWNRVVDQAEQDRSWRYDADSNFTRDAQRALRQLLAPGWIRPAG